MNTFSKTYDHLNHKPYVTMEEAEDICENYPGFSWIKDKKCIFVKTNQNNSSFLKLSSPDMIVGATDFDFEYSTIGHTSYDFRLIDQCVIKGLQYSKKVELLVIPDEAPLFTLVTKICIFSNTHKALAVLGIAQPLTQDQILNLDGVASLAPVSFWTTEFIPEPLTDAERHIQILRNKFKLSVQEIAIIRNTSKRTIDAHLYNIRVKLYGNANYRPKNNKNFRITDPNSDY